MAKTLFRIADVQAFLDVDRQTLHSWIRAFHIQREGADRPRTRGTRAVQLDEKAVVQLRLIAALKKDIRFEDSEILSLLRKISPDEFITLLNQLPFPKLLAALRDRKIAIDETRHLDSLVECSTVDES
jgi:hypothetical protein